MVLNASLVSFSSWVYHGIPQEHFCSLYPQGTFGTVWGHFWLPCLGSGVPVHLAGRGWERAMQPAALRTAPGRRMTQSQLSAVLGPGNPALSRVLLASHFIPIVLCSFAFHGDG